MNIGIILAAGEGSRMGVKGASKTTIDFEGKPLIEYGVDLFDQVVEQIYIVVGAYSESVKNTLAKHTNIKYVEQSERKGTGHALIAALKQMELDGLNPEMILLGYGDHMMFYTPKVLNDLIEKHRSEQSAVSLISTVYEDPNYIAWGRIIRDKRGEVINIIEQNDATPEQREIKESNAGFYCLDFKFALASIKTVLDSKSSGEYYVNDFTYLALKNKKHVSVLQVPFELVGIGINTHDQLSESLNLFQNKHQTL